MQEQHDYLVSPVVAAVDDFSTEVEQVEPDAIWQKVMTTAIGRRTDFTTEPGFKMPTLSVMVLFNNNK